MAESSKPTGETPLPSPQAAVVDDEATTTAPARASAPSALRRRPTAPKLAKPPGRSDSGDTVRIPVDFPKDELDELDELPTSQVPSEIVADTARTPPNESTRDLRRDAAEVGLAKTQPEIVAASPTRADTEDELDTRGETLVRRRAAPLPRPGILAKESGSTTPADLIRDPPRAAPPSTQTAPVPRGIVPPSAPKAATAAPRFVASSDTGAFVALVAADLMTRHSKPPAPATADVPTAPPAAKARPAAVVPKPTRQGPPPQAPTTRAPDSDPLLPLAPTEAEDVRPPTRWPGAWWHYAAAAVAAVVLLWWAGGSTSEPDPTQAALAVQNPVTHEPSPPQAAHVAAPAPATATASVAATPGASAPSTRSLPAAPEPTPEAPPSADDGLEDENPEVAVETPQDMDPTQATGSVAEARTEPGRATRKRRSKRRRSRPKTTTASTPESSPKPARPTTSTKAKATKTSSSDQSASGLLRRAKGAFASGRYSTAYRLASSSNAKSRSSAALRVMARSACRMRQPDRARRAFKSLSVGSRSGVRSECRRFGIKLGL